MYQYELPRYLPTADELPCIEQQRQRADSADRLAAKLRALGIDPE